MTIKSPNRVTPCPVQARVSVRKRGVCAHTLSRCWNVLALLRAFDRANAREVVPLRVSAVNLLPVFPIADFAAYRARGGQEAPALQALHLVACNGWRTG